MTVTSSVHRSFRQVDVFGARPLRGNPVAVVLDGSGLSTEQMQDFTRWTNLSETTFVLPPTVPEADYRLRIFTLAGELPFAGHPTLGSCHAWLEAGGQPGDPDRIVQQCDAGLIEVRRSHSGLKFAAPPLVRSGPVDPALRDAILGELGVEEGDVVDMAWADNGPGWVAVLLGDPELLARIRPRLRGGADETRDVGVVAMSADGPHAYELRAFFTDHNGQTLEDPVTGSLNATVADWLIETGRVRAPYTAAQGQRVGREGRIEITQEFGKTWIGGTTYTVLRGTASI